MPEQDKVVSGSVDESSDASRSGEHEVDTARLRMLDLSRSHRAGPDQRSEPHKLSEPRRSRPRRRNLDDSSRLKVELQRGRGASRLNASDGQELTEDTVELHPSELEALTRRSGD